MYEYRCTVLRVVDGDTLDLDIDLGLSLHAHTRVRLNGLDAPEMSTDAGKTAKAFVLKWVADYGPDFTVETIKDHGDKYGRLLAVLHTDQFPYGASLNTDLRRAGLAKPYDGGKRG